MGEPEFLATALKFQSASKHPLPILSELVAQSRLKPHSGKYIPQSFWVTKFSKLNLLGRDAMKISLDNILF